jgi:hypothetical protein
MARQQCSVKAQQGDLASMTILLMQCQPKRDETRLPLVRPL